MINRVVAGRRKMVLGVLLGTSALVGIGAPQQARAQFLPPIGGTGTPLLTACPPGQVGAPPACVPAPPAPTPTPAPTPAPTPPVQAGITTSGTTITADLGSGNSATLNLTTIASNVTTLIAKSGALTVGGTPPLPNLSIYAGTGSAIPAVTFTNTSGLTGDIYVNGAPIVAMTSGAFGIGKIHAIDPTIRFSASGIYANPISLESADPVNDPTMLVADPGVTATLTGQITENSSLPQPLTFTGGGTIVLSTTNPLSNQNSYRGATTIDAGTTVTLAGGTYLSGTSNVANSGTLNVIGGSQLLVSTGPVEIGSATSAIGGSLRVSQGGLVATGPLSPGFFVNANGNITIGGTSGGMAEASGQIGGAVNLSDASSKLIVNITNNDYLLANKVSGTGEISIEHKILNLNSDNLDFTAFTGKFTVNATASLNIFGDAALDLSRNTVVNNGYLDLTELTSLAVLGNVIGDDPTAIIYNESGLEIDNASGEYAGSFMGAGTLGIRGTGAYTLSGSLSGASLYVDGVSGPVAVTLTQGYSGEDGVSVLNGATLTLAGGAFPAPNRDAVRISGGGTVNIGNPTATGYIQGDLHAVYGTDTGASPITVNVAGFVQSLQTSAIASNGGGLLTVTNSSYIVGKTYGIESIAPSAGGGGGAVAVTNGEDYRIIAGIDAIYGVNSTDAVSNAGTILAGTYSGGQTILDGEYAVNLTAGGGISNYGAIKGFDAGIYSGGALKLINTGVINTPESAGTGLSRDFGGGVNGVVVNSGDSRDSVIVNSGTIFAGAFNALALSNGGTVTNAVSGLIRGGDDSVDGNGITLGNGATIDNYGYITSATQSAIYQPTNPDGSNIGSTINLYAGSTTDAIKLGDGDDTVTIYNGRGTSATDATTQTYYDAVDPTKSVLITLQQAGPLDRAFFNSIDFGGGTNTLVLAGAGDGSDANGQSSIASLDVLTGITNLTKRDSGLWALSDIGTYTGLTTISGGTLELGSNANISASSGVVNDATLLLSRTAASKTINNLTGTTTNAAVVLSNTSLTIANASGRYAGAITGTTQLEVGGTGTYELGGAISTTGGIRQTGAGTLTIGGALTNATSQSEVNVTAAGASVIIASGGSIDVGGIGVVGRVANVSITNLGSVKSASTAVNLTNGGSFANGSATNATASVSGASGVSIAGTATAFDNWGTITATNARNGNAALINNGALTNHLGATLDSQYIALLAGSAAGTGTITNDGTITSTNLGVVSNRTTTDLVNTGSLTAVSTAVSNRAYGGTLNLTNSGSIISTATAPTAAVGSFGGGTVINTGTIQGSGNPLSFVGSLTLINSGAIASTGTFSGVVTNDGSATGVAGGATSITNQAGGMISAGTSAVRNLVSADTLASTTVDNKARAVIVGGIYGVNTVNKLTGTNAGMLVGGTSGVIATSDGTSINNSGLIGAGTYTSNTFTAATGGTAIDIAGGAVANTGTGQIAGTLTSSAGLTFDNAGTAGAVTATGTEASTLTFYAGSTTGAVTTGSGGDSLTLYTGSGTGSAAVANPLNPMTTLVGAGPHAAATVGAIDLGVGANNVLTLRGAGDGSDVNGVGGAIDLSVVSNVTTLTKQDSGTWTLTGASTSPIGLIQAGTGGTPGSSGLLVFAGSGLTAAINVNGGAIRADTAGGFGTGLITAFDPTIQYNATGSYANPILLASGDPVGDPTMLQAGNGIVATLTGAITQTMGDGETPAPVQPLVFGRIGGATTGTGTIILTNTANDWGGVTTINAATTLQGNLNTISGSNIVDNGTLIYDTAIGSVGGVVSRVISGSGTLIKQGSDTITLSAASTYTGPTTVAAGVLDITGSIVSAVTVQSGATLRGTGSVGATTIADGGILAGAQGATLGLASLGLSSGSIINAAFTAPGGTPLFSISGDLTLDGTVNVSAGDGAFGLGVYRLATYGGMLTDNGLSVGSTPPGTIRLTVQTSVSGQVNLVNAPNDLLFWDGGNAALYDNGAVDGGSGTWTTTSPTWTSADGASNGAMAPQPGFAIFQASPGTVTVSNSSGAVSVTGIQFAANGYNVVGDAITLAAPTTATIRVGDGTAAGAGFTATIGAALTGANSLEKTDLGTLVLTGTNSWTGATTLTAGTLVGTTASIAGSSIADNGTLIYDQSTDGTVTAAISGAGSLVKLGSGTVTLGATNSYVGGTTVTGGTLRASGNGGAIRGAVAIASGASLELNVSGGLIAQNAATFTGAGRIVKTGAGALALGNAGPVAIALSAGGLFDVQAGVVRGSSSNQGDWSANMGSLNIAAGATFDGVEGMIRVDALTGNGQLAGGFNASASTTIGVANGSGTFAGTITDSSFGLGVLRLTKIGTGTQVLTGNNSYTGATTISGGTLALAGTGSITSSAIVDNAVFSIAGLTNGGTSIASLAGTGSVLLGANTLSVGSDNSNTTFAGVVGGSGGLSKVGTGTLTLSGANSYTGATTVAAGTLALGASNVIADTSNVAVSSGAILNLGAFNDTAGTLALNGALNGTGTLTAASYTLNGGTANANLGAGVLTQAGGSSMLNGTSAAATVNVNAGTLALGASNRLADTAAVAVANGAILNLGAFNDAVGTLALNGTLNGTGTLTAASYTLIGGTSNANLGAGVLTQAGGTSMLNGTSGAATVNVNAGTLALGASDRLADTAAVAVSSGAILNLGAFNDTAGTLALSGTLNGTGTLTAASYTLNAGVVNANLGAGVLTQAGGTSVLNGTSAAATVNVNAGTLALGASNRLADTAAVAVANGAILNLGAFNDAVGTLALNGTLNGTGTLTAASYTLIGGTSNANLGAGVLTQAGGTSMLNGTSGAATVNVNAGTLALGASDRLADTAAVAVSSGAILNLGAFNDTAGTLALSGTLNGTGTLTAASYTLNAGVVNANLGAGVLTQAGGTSVLNGTSAAATVNVNAGTLAIGASNRLADTAAVAVSSGAILNLGAFNDTVGALSLSGTLNGTGTLTAASYTLNGGTANANLGAGVLTQASGTSMLNGTSGAATVNVNAGTLALGASNRLADTATVAIASGATLNIGAFTDTVGLLQSSGTLNGTGTLTAAQYQLTGATVNANLGAGTLFNLGGTSVLNGTAAASAVNINAGTLVLGASDRLADTATVAIASGATLNLGAFTDTVGLFQSSGTLNGTGTLTAAQYQLTGATVNANLGAGTLFNLGGTSVLNGTAAAAAVNVNAGTLVLGASDRLADTATVAIASGATLNLGAFNDTVGLLQSSGTLAGTGTLTAAQYQLTGATVNANLGAGTLFNLGGTSVLNGTAAASLVSINAGTLLLGANERLADTASVAVNAGATFDLGGKTETIGALFNGSNGGGTIALGAGTLLVGAANGDFGYSGAITGTGDVTKVGTGTFSLLGNLALTGRLNVNAGTLMFAGTTAGSVRVQGGTLTGSAAIAGNLALASGTLSPGTASQPIAAFQAGSLTVTGGTAAFDFSGSAGGFSADLLRVSGAATLSGGTVVTRATEATANYRVEQMYQLIGAAGVTGTFANGSSFTSVSNDSNLAWRLRYDLNPNAVILEVRKQIDYTAGLTGASGNQLAVGAALNGATLTASDAYVSVLDLIAQGTPAQRAATYDSIGGEALADVNTAVALAGTGFADLLRLRLRSDDGGQAGNATILGGLLGKEGTSEAVRAAAAVAPGLGVAGDGGDHRISGWLQAFGSSNKLSGLSGQASTLGTYVGVGGGLDARFGSLAVGIGVATNNVDTSVRTRTSRNAGNLKQAGGYVAYDDGALYGNVVGSYFEGDIDTTRSVFVNGGLFALARGVAPTSGYTVGGALGYRLPIGKTVKFTPQISYEMVDVKRDAFTETGAGVLSLAVAGQTRTLYSGTVEGRLSDTIRTGNGGTVTPYIGGGMRFNMGDLDATSLNRFSGAPVGSGAFTITGAKLSPRAALINGGIEAKPSERVSIGIGADAAFAKRQKDARVTMSIKIGF